MDLRKFNFKCPHCDTPLDDKDSIQLKTLRNNGDEGTIYLSVKFGNYTFHHDPDVTFEGGEVVDFLCPHCNTTLNAPDHENYALLKMRVNDTVDFEVIFSREAGKRKTYVITEDGIETYQG